MAKITFSNSALSDLKSIYMYIANDSEVYAAQVISKIQNRIAILGTHAYSGRMVPEFGSKSIREIIEGNYRIIYKIIDETEISIVRIFHRARLLTEL